MSYLKYIFSGKPQASSTDHEFKMLYSFERRKRESDKIFQEYPNTLPLILEKSDKSTITDIQKHKFLVPKSMTIGQFIFSLRKMMKINQADGLYLFVNNYFIPKTSSTFEEVYKKYKDKDGFLYIIYSGESVFG